MTISPSSMPAPRPLEMIPDELLIHILSFVSNDPKKISTLRKVCRRVNVLISSNVYHIWHPLVCRWISAYAPRLKDPYLHLRNLVTQQVVGNTIYNDKSNFMIALVLQRRHLASRSSKGLIRFWDLKSGECKKTISSGPSWTTGIALSRNQSLYYGALDGSIICQSLENDESRRLEGHRLLPRFLILSKDNKYLLSASEDHSVIWWDLESENHLVLNGHTDIVNCIALHEESAIALSGSFDNTARLWNLRTGECSQVFENKNMQLAFIASDASTVFYACRNQVRIWNIEDGKESILYSHAAAVGALALSPDQTKLLSGGDDHDVIFFDIASKTRLLTLHHAHWVTFVAFSESGTELYSASHDGTVKEWKL